MTKAYLLLLAIVVCFFMAGRSTYNFVAGLFPVAQPGECVDVTFAGQHTKLKVISNSTSKSIVISYRNNRIVELSHSDLRDMEATKVSCE